MLDTEKSKLALMAHERGHAIVWQTRGVKCVIRNEGDGLLSDFLMCVPLLTVEDGDRIENLIAVNALSAACAAMSGHLTRLCFASGESALERNYTPGDIRCMWNDDAVSESDKKSWEDGWLFLDDALFREAMAAAVGIANDCLGDVCHEIRMFHDIENGNILTLQPLHHLAGG